MGNDIGSGLAQFVRYMDISRQQFQHTSSLFQLETKTSFYKKYWPYTGYHIFSIYI